jgi:hypothetical protein
MRALVVIALATATMCTPAAKPGPASRAAPSAVPSAPGINVTPDLCSGARQHLVEMGCPPPERHFGEWEATCSAKSGGQSVARCIMLQSVCSDARVCEE